MTADELRNIRVSLKLNQQKLAEALEISVGSIARWEAKGANLGKWPIPKWAQRELRRIVAQQKYEAQP